VKRINNIYHNIISIENLRLADDKAQKGKSNQYGVKLHNKNKEDNLLKLHEMLFNKTYKPSPYKIFTIHEPKERQVYKADYFPERIIHHAVMNYLEHLFVACFTADTFSCIKRRGIHAAANAVKKALQDEANTTYCLKLDIKKFYLNINHDVLKQLLRKKIKDYDLLWLLDIIIDSAEGLPIGNYLSQYFANFYLAYFDHWIKETKRIKYYFRYADDLVILANNKTFLHNLFCEMQQYLQQNLKLTVKENYQVFPVKSRGIDFVGYKFYHTHTLLRKTIKQRFARMLKRNKNVRSIASYYGWAKHCNSTNLLNKLLKPHEQL
jgi:retron-type reverse transcriptase